MSKSEEKVKEPIKEVRGVAHLGQGAMIGVPARDLSLGEINELGLDIGVLVASGAYVHVYADAVTEPEIEEPETKSKE